MSYDNKVLGLLTCMLSKENFAGFDLEAKLHLLFIKNRVDVYSSTKQNQIRMK